MAEKNESAPDSDVTLFWRSALAAARETPRLYFLPLIRAWACITGGIRPADPSTEPLDRANMGEGAPRI